MASQLIKAQSTQMSLKKLKASFPMMVPVELRIIPPQI